MAEAPDSAAAGPVLVITRVFEAPRDLVFKAWTERERLMRWWGPKRFTMVSCTLDLRPGGLFHYCVRSPAGKDLWGKLVYREIVAPQRLVFVVSFSDEEGKTRRNPWSPDWPLEVLNSVTFAEHGGRTTVTMWAVPINATEVERKTFEAGHDSVRLGTAGTLDRLAAELASSQDHNAEEEAIT
jgi:uncharacterized protein YndB with AHSA1/START domain